MLENLAFPSGRTAGGGFGQFRTSHPTDLGPESQRATPTPANRAFNQLHSMSFITAFFIKPKKPALVQLPTGTFTIDRNGQIITSTLPQSFHPMDVQTIGNNVLAAFRSAERAEMRFAEFIIHYSGLKVLAREQRGGAIVFVMPQNLRAKPETSQLDQKSV
jgi:hypothetical protein